MRSMSRCLSLVLILVPTACWCAVTYRIDLYDGYFEPKALTILAGDSVTFTNVSLLGAKNVHDVADSFRCSVGCRGDGSGATGNPSKLAWSDTLTFNTPGAITYVSDQQISEGMIGTITVNSVASAPPIVSGLSGNWYNPTPGQDGHGVQLEILPNNGIVAIWFVFTPDAKGQTWLYAQGTYDPTRSTVTLQAYLSLGAAFPPNYSSGDRHLTPWGTLTFEFFDCDSGTMSWNSTTAGYWPTGSFPISHLTKILGTTCP